MNLRNIGLGRQKRIYYRQRTIFEKNGAERAMNSKKDKEYTLKVTMTVKNSYHLLMYYCMYAVNEKSKMFD